MNELSYILSFLEGILTFISPCILPMLPIYFFYLAGVSAGENINRRKLLFNAIGFVLGFSIVFVLLGATATALGSFLKDNIGIFKKISGLIMVMFGLNFMGILNLRFLNIEKRFDYEFKDLEIFNSIIWGMVFGFGWTPCVGAFLGSALLMAANSQSLYQGILLLVLYSAGLGLPFILTSIIFSNINSKLRKIQKLNRMIIMISGIVLIFTGILVFLNKI